MKPIVETLNPIRAALSISTKLVEKETLPRIKGFLFLKAWENGELVYSFEDHNVIVNSASILIARLLKNSSEPPAGISYLAVGTGITAGPGAWNTANPPAPTVVQTTLASELARKHIDDANTRFVDPNTGAYTLVATNIVDFSTTFNEADAVGPIMEMGLFGGNATAELGSGTLMNYRTFPVLNKTSSMTFSVVFRISC